MSFFIIILLYVYFIYIYSLLLKVKFEIDILYKRVILIIEIWNKKNTDENWQKNIISLALKNIRRNKIENYFQHVYFSNISYNKFVQIKRNFSFIVNKGIIFLKM